MIAYLVLLLAILSRILPHIFATTSVGFTAVGGGLLFFGARRSRWQTIIAVLALMATDFYLTVYVYGAAFHAARWRSRSGLLNVVLHPEQLHGLGG